MKDSIDRRGFRANVGIILSDHSRAVLVGGRLGQTGWQFPQGGIQRDETPEGAMYRELREEIGLEPGDVEVLACTCRWLYYRLPQRFVRHDRRPLCIGQKQRWYLLRLVGDERKVQLDTTDRPEFDRWRWVDFWRPVKDVIYFKRKVYVQALHSLAPALFPDGVPPQPGWWPQRWRARPD
jgi:putative (di)nucleoside polyphosphate hydrolase